MMPTGFAGPLDAVRPRIVVHTFLGDFVADPLGTGVNVPGISGYDVVFNDVPDPPITQLAIGIAVGLVIAGIAIGKVL